jgi:hypothetical protein
MNEYRPPVVTCVVYSWILSSLITKIFDNIFYVDIDKFINEYRPSVVTCVVLVGLRLNFIITGNWFFDNIFMLISINS